MKRELASLTIQAMNDSIVSDNGTSFKHYQKEILPLMNDAYENGGKRTHLGASVIGDECLRKIWLNFRYAKNECFDANLIRLFNRGHLEEGRIISNLESADIHVSFVDKERNGKQYGGKIGWFGSSIDGLTSDTKEYPNELIILEFKTMSDKRFKEFVDKGIEEKFQNYYRQSIVNIENMNRQYNYNIDKVLLIGVNKNTDEIFGEYIHADQEVANALIDLANELAINNTIPPTLKPNSAFFPCKFCSLKDICFNGEECDHSCRTCAMCYRDNDGEHCSINGEAKFSEDCYVPFEMDY